MLIALPFAHRVSALVWLIFLGMCGFALNSLRIERMQGYEVAAFFGRPLFVQDRAIVAEIKKNKAIRQATIRRILPSTLEIDAIYRIPLARVGAYALDEEGVLFESGAALLELSCPEESYPKLGALLTSIPWRGSIHAIDCASQSMTVMLRREVTVIFDKPLAQVTQQELVRLGQIRRLLLKAPFHVQSVFFRPYAKTIVKKAIDPYPL